MKSAVAMFGASRPGRAWKRYADARGGILAAGVGYFAFFSIFRPSRSRSRCSASCYGGHPDLLRTIFGDLGAYLPGLVRDGQHPEGLIPVQAPKAVALTITGVIAFVVLVLAGLGWLRATREGIRAVLGARGSGGTLITNAARDLGVLFTLGLGIALFAVLTSAVGAAAGWIAGRIGMSGDGWIVILAGFAVSVLADTGLMIVLLRVVFGVSVPWHDLFQGGAGWRCRAQPAEDLRGRPAASADRQPVVRLLRDRGRTVGLAQLDRTADPDLGEVGRQRP